ncbi:MAG: OsmC family protein [Cyclobacteriaceae bacterium]|jgi:hypothetical protein
MVSAIIGTDHFRNEITVGGKMVIADEPEELDGTNQGPQPENFC